MNPKPFSTSAGASSSAPPNNQATASSVATPPSNPPPPKPFPGFKFWATAHPVPPETTAEKWAKLYNSADSKLYARGKQSSEYAATCRREGQTRALALELLALNLSSSEQNISRQDSSINSDVASNSSSLQAHHPANTSAMDSKQSVKKKGTAAPVKKPTNTKKKTPAGKKTTGLGGSSQAVTADENNNEVAESDEDDEDGDANDSDISDKAIYCICKGLDDGSYMVGCEGCEEWFHAKCVGIDEKHAKETLQKYVCDKCKTDNFCTTWVYHCDLPGCIKRCRRKADGCEINSKFCSEEHATQYMKKLVDAAPDSDEPSRGGILTKQEIAAMVNWSHKAADIKSLGQRPTIEVGPDFDFNTILNEEEQARIVDYNQKRVTAYHRRKLFDGKKTFLQIVTKMGREISAQAGDNVCGYTRLLAVNEPEFELFQKSPQGIAAFETGRIEDTTSFCRVKKCAKHREWMKIEIEEFMAEQKWITEELATLDKKEHELKEHAKTREAMRQQEAMRKD